jgi:hypothetical protein
MPIPNERPRTYDKKEREVIDPFKERYMNTTTPAERRSLAQGHIFPELFTYWSSIGIDLNPDEMNKRTDVSKSLNYM